MRTILVAAVVLAAVLPQQAAPPDRVYITFNSAVRVPGTQLEAGTYVFVPGRSIAGQIVIDIYRARDMSLAASCLALESAITRPSTTTLLDYSGSTPPFLRAWFHPAFSGGFEFVYPPDDAAAIFGASGTPVPSAVFPAGERAAGVLPIQHVDDAYRPGRPAPEQHAGRAEEPGPIDQLMLARLAILTHLHEVRPGSAMRLRLLNRQLADLTTAYWAGTGDAVFRLRLVRTALGNSGFADDHAALHVIERVRERVERFAAFLR